MIVDFVNLSTPVHWLDVGALLEAPDGSRWEKVGEDQYSTVWAHVNGEGGDGVSHLSNDHMSVVVGDGVGWKIATIIPDVIYVVVDASCGSIDVGQGHGGASRVRAFMTRERAEKAIKNMGRYQGNDVSSYRVVAYKMNDENREEG